VAGSGEPLGDLLLGAAALLQLDDGDELLGLIDGYRDGRDPAAGDLLHRGFDVLGVVVAPVHDQQVLDAAHDEEFGVRHEAQITGAQPGPLGSAR
jgi:hypothetical protein